MHLQELTLTASQMGLALQVMLIASPQQPPPPPPAQGKTTGATLCCACGLTDVSRPNLLRNCSQLPCTLCTMHFGSGIHRVTRKNNRAGPNPTCKQERPCANLRQQTLAYLYITDHCTRTAQGVILHAGHAAEMGVSQASRGSSTCVLERGFLKQATSPAADRALADAVILSRFALRLL